MAANNRLHRPPVGVSTHEAILTGAVLERPHEVMAAEAEGRALVVLEEVALGLGRPDLILMNVDLRVLALRAAAGLRLQNLTEARALGSLLSAEPASSGVSVRHFQRLSHRLETRGWLDSRVASRIVSDSLLIEAKMTHWGKGVQQLARVRWASHSAALLVPEDTATNIPAAMLRFNGIGLLTKSAGELRWRRPSPRSDLPFHIDAWLGELVTRALES